MKIMLSLSLMLFLSFESIQDVLGQSCGIAQGGNGNGGSNTYVVRRTWSIRVWLKSHRSAPIIDGTRAEEKAWPWLVAITHKGHSSASCTGFLIDSRHVISAAHCINPKSYLNDYEAIVGNVDFHGGIRLGFSRIVFHGGYKPPLSYNDIAVFTLDRKVNFPGFTPICLPPKNMNSLEGQLATFAGWGKTQRAKGAGSSRFLMKLSNKQIISDDECSNILRRRTNYAEAFPHGFKGLLCTTASSKSDICNGDSGGPLMIRAGGRFYAVGIAIYTFECGAIGIPSGYTRISSHLDWIHANLNDV